MSGLRIVSNSGHPQRTLRRIEPANHFTPIPCGKTHSYLCRDARMQNALAKSLHLCADMVHKSGRGGGETQRGDEWVFLVKRVSFLLFRVG